MFNLAVTWLITAYIFINAIPYTPAARYLLLGTLLFLTLTGLYKGYFKSNLRSPVVLALVLFVSSAFISAINSPYLTDSLQGFRKDYLPPLFVLFIATSLQQTAEEKQRFAQSILNALVAGFALKTILALWDGAINHPFIFSPYSNLEFYEKNGLPKYVSYYAVESVLYLTLAYSILAFLCRTWVSRITLLGLCSTSFFILLVSGIRSAFAALLIGMLITTLIKLRTPKRILAFAVIALTIVSGAVPVGKNNTEVNRYIDLFKIERYSKQEAMSGRYQIWEGVSELIAQRPLLGFGTSWQNIPTAAQDGGFINKWQQEKTSYGEYKHWYFSLEPGKVNPHNLMLQVLFETGLAGLITYFIMLSTLFWGAFTAPAHGRTVLSQWLRCASVGYFAALLIIDVTNSLLMHNTMVALMLIVVLVRQSTSTESQPSLQSSGS